MDKRHVKVEDHNHNNGLDSRGMQGEENCGARD